MKRLLSTPTARICALAALLAGCAHDRPDPNATISAASLEAPYPVLEPLEALLARADAGTRVETDAAILQARLAALKQRAAALRGRSIFDGASRLKLFEAAARNSARLSR